MKKSFLPLVVTALSMAVWIPASSEGATIWTGTISSDWNVAGNWDNGVPGVGNDATINAGALNQPTYNSATTLEGFAITQNGGTATGTRSGGVNQFNLGNSGAPITWNLNGGSLDVSGPTLGLRLNFGSTINLDGGTLNAGTRPLDLTHFGGQDYIQTSGSTTVGAALLNRRTEFSMAGGSFTSTTFSVANAGLATSPNYDISFSGGTSSLGNLEIYWADAGRPGQMSVLGDAEITVTDLLFGQNGTVTDFAGRDSTFIDFDSTWTGSFLVSGQTSLSDYWTLFNTPMVTNPFIRLDGALIDETTFLNTFLLSPTNALTLVPEPSTGLLALFGVAALALRGRVRRRNGTA